MVLNVCCLLTSGKRVSWRARGGQRESGASGNENEVRQHGSVARLAHRQGFPDWFFIPNKRQKASRPVATGIGGGQLWGPAGLWRSYVLHRIWGCYLRLPTSVSISEHVKLVIRRLCLCSFHLSLFFFFLVFISLNQFLAQRISLLEGLGVFCGLWVSPASCLLTLYCLL